MRVKGRTTDDRIAYLTKQMDKFHAKLIRQIQGNSHRIPETIAYLRKADKKIRRLRKRRGNAADPVFHEAQK